MNDLEDVLLHQYYHDVPQDDPHREKVKFVEDEQDHYMKEHAMVKPITHRVDYEPDIPFYVVLESHLADAYESNEMSTRTFPGIKPQKYDPEAMARALEKARAEGKKDAKAEEKEEEFDYHKVVHRH